MSTGWRYWSVTCDLTSVNSSWNSVSSSCFNGASCRSAYSLLGRWNYNWWPKSDAFSRMIFCNFNPLTATVVVWVRAIKHPVPDRVKPSFVIFDIRALCILFLVTCARLSWSHSAFQSTLNSFSSPNYNPIPVLLLPLSDHRYRLTY